MEGYIKSGSANIFYEIFGEENEKSLILLHGNNESSRHYKKLIPLLADKYKVIAIDSRGHGRSDFGGNSLSIGTMAVDLMNVIDALGLEKVNIVGFSDGANIAMIAGIKNSDVIEKMVLVSGNYNFWGMKPLYALMVAIGYYCSFLGGFVDSRNKFNKEYFSLMFKEPNLKRSSLNYINADTLVICSDKDMIKYSHSKNIAKSIKKASLKVVKGDHFWIYKNPEEASKVIKEYIK